MIFGKRVSMHCMMERRIYSCATSNIRKTLNQLFGFHLGKGLPIRLENKFLFM